MDGGVERLLEAIRQRALVRSGRLYGQVPCDEETHVLFTSCGRRCIVCKAAV